ncbi:SDR family NAD(P)-dependent oxidoreductase [Bacillus cihuensis]|uniref:SDR family NAD(P)-dependent oxidoreductase n=1 Tax=Bacillus cihuensis TaxID=1208599 RepID=UPI001268814C
MSTYGITADASESNPLIAAFDQIESDYGVPDVLIYNAGANTISTSSILNQQDLLNDFNVNVAGALTILNKLYQK